MKRKNRRRGKRKTMKRCYTKKNLNRRGKWKKWLAGGLAALTPSILAIGYGTAKQLLKKNTGYSDIYV